MTLNGDQLAGIVDLFGGLERGELFTAIEELQYRRGEETDDETIGDRIEDAIESYHLVRLHRETETLIVPGPAAFPDPPDGSEDLPHIVDVPRRSIDRDAVATAALEQLQRDADSAIRAADIARARRLLEVTYDIESYGDVDATDVRARLERVDGD
jgi:hypothetical protein